MQDIIITAIGAVTSVGLDAVTTCASIRAGISRPETVFEHAVLDREEHETIGLTGHPISLVTRGFTGGGRWIQMAALALEDLCRSAQLPPADDTPFWSSTLCTIVTPVIDVRRFIREEAWATEDMVRGGLLAALDRRVAPFCSLARSTVGCRGRVGVLEALSIAAEHIRQRRYERVVVLAVDSLTDGTGLMTRYVLDDGSLEAEERQRALLNRWDEVLERRSDPRRELCEALLHRDARAFHTTFDATSEAREADLRRRLADHTLPADDAAWSLPVWLEGLALLRLAERDGLQTEACIRGIPLVCRPNASQRLHANP